MWIPLTVLEKLDFHKLRGKHPELAGCRENTTVELIVSGENDISIRIGTETTCLQPEDYK